MKKLLGMCLIVTLVLNCSFPTFAFEHYEADNDVKQCRNYRKNGEINIKNFSPNNLKLDGYKVESERLIQNEVDYLEKMGILSCANAVKVNIEKNNTISYEVEFNDVKNEITVLEDDDQGFKVLVSQDNLKNTIEVRKDGTVVIDGDTAGNINSSSYDKVRVDEIMPDSVKASTILTGKCPYGSASDYSYKLGSNSDSDISLNKTIESYTMSAFIAFIVPQLHLGVKAAFVVGNALELGYTHLCNNYPSTSGLSFKTVNYAHKKYHDTYIKPIDMYVVKCRITWYPKKNFKGTAYTENTYQVKSFT